MNVDREIWEEILQDYHERSESIVDILYDIQERCGCVKKECISYLSERLKRKEIEIYSLVTFYHGLSMEPQGKYRIEVCGGTGCHLKNKHAKEDIIRCILSHLGLSKIPDQTKDGWFSVSVSTHCMGACGAGPVVKINDVLYTGMTEHKVEEILETLKQRNQ